MVIWWSTKCKDIGGFNLAESAMSTLPCPSFGSLTVVKNGCIHNGKQNYKCRDCGRQFVEAPQQKRIDPNTKDFINKLLLEKMPLVWIVRVCDVSENWLQEYVNQKYATVPQTVTVSSKQRPINPPM